MDDSKEQCHQTEQGWCTHGLTEAMAAHTAFTKWGPSKEKKWTQIYAPDQEALCNWNLLGKGKSVFYNEGSLGISATLQSTSLTWDKLGKKDKMVVICSCLGGACFFYIGILSYWFGFTCLDFNVSLFWERERTLNWVGKEVGKIWK